MTMIESIKIRRSCRTYSPRAIEPGKIAQLSRFLAENVETPFGNTPRFHLLDFNEVERGELKKLTTYGVIQGAGRFIVREVEKYHGAMEDYGYAMERNILQATSLGLGTCILGGTFSRSGFAGKIGLSENKVLPAISPVGYPAGQKSMVDRMFRFIAASGKRKPWRELFYLDNFDSIDPDDPDLSRYRTPLECVRLAPSASNRQPWRVIRGKESKGLFHFYLKRTPGYEKLFKDINLQNVDLGIALCHFELSAGELGLKGEWAVSDPQLRTDGWEYIASWTGDDHRKSHGGNTP